MNEYTFNISLSILNHLGRNLYRSFITVLGEAISNAWMLMLGMSNYNRS